MSAFSNGYALTCDSEGTPIFGMPARMEAPILPELAREIEQVEKKSPQAIYFDLGQVDCLDSRCLGAILGWHRHFFLRGIDFRLIRVSNRIMDVLRVSNLENVLNIGPAQRQDHKTHQLQSEALWQSHQYTEQIISALGGGLLGLDRQGIIIFVNPTLATMLECAEQSLLGRRLQSALVVRNEWEQPIAPEDCPLMAVAMGRKDPLFGELVIRHVEGQKSLPVRVSGKTIFRNQLAMGAIVGFLDISDRKRAEQQLQEREEFNFALFQSSPLESIIVDRQGRVVRSNMAMRHSGRPLPPIGAVLFRDYDIDDKGMMHGELMRCLRDGVSGEFPDVCRDGRRLSVAIAPFAHGAIVISHDVTDRFKAIAQMTRLNDCLMGLGADITENICHLVALCGEMLGAVCAFYGRREKGRWRIIGEWRMAPDMLHDCPKVDVICDNIIAHAGAGPLTAQDVQFPGADQSGEDDHLFHLETCVGQRVCVTGAPIGALCAFFRESHEPSEGDTKMIGVLASAICTEEQRRIAEQEKLALREQLRQNQRLEALGRLAGGVAHDFNNLLTIMTCVSESLMEGFDPDHPAFGMAEKVHRAARSGANLTRQLLAFGRKQVLIPKVAQLNLVIRNFQKMLIRLIGADIEFLVQLQEDLGLIRADTGQLEQVIINLVVNARDAMPAGGTLRIRTFNAQVQAEDLQGLPEARSGAFSVMEVSDTGHGIAEDILPNIFDPFFTTKDETRGTGLGLSTVYGIVQQTGGFLTVHSQPDQGSTFSIYLPQVAIDQKIEPEEALAVAPTSRNPIPSGAVLVAEDHEAIRELICDILKKNGYHVLAARDGQEALEMAENGAGPFSVLVTDVIMPRMGGVELADRLTSILPDLRVVFTSGHVGLTVSSDEMERPGRAFLAKPFTETRLLTCLYETLRDPR